jgi:hypothetical protein
VEFADGSSFTAEQMSDETHFANYVRESVLTPQAKIVKGFGPQMNSYQGQVKPEDLADIIAFMKTLSDKYVPPAAAPKPGEAPATPSGGAAPTPPAGDGAPGGAKKPEDEKKQQPPPGGGQ